LVELGRNDISSVWFAQQGGKGLLMVFAMKMQQIFTSFITIILFHGKKDNDLWVMG
jgi:hypothetical protein